MFAVRCRQAYIVLTVASLVSTTQAKIMAGVVITGITTS